MKPEKKIEKSLAAATCALLGAAVPQGQAIAQEQPDRWKLDTALMYYGESDSRVQDLSLSVLGRRDFDDERYLTMNLSVDTLTGASASGATALGRPQTFTSPSGDGTYTTNAGEVPLDDTFLDTRIAFSANWSQPLSRLYKAGVGFSFSTEYDYVHKGVNLSLTRDFARRNTTLSAGLALAQDDWQPVGGAPQALSQMRDVGDKGNRQGDQSKDIVDLLLGVTQVINRDLVVQLNYSYSDASGYLNDPYKIMSVVDGITGDTVMRTPGAGASGPDGMYVFEGRPDSRTRHGVFARGKYNWTGKVVDLSYRYSTDDWQIDSHTLDGRLRLPLGSGSYVEPHLRYYTQSEAEFYRSSLVDGATLPAFASADFRLGNFDAVTVGAEFGHRAASNSEWSVRLEYYTQTGDVPSTQIIGNQAGQEQYPDLSAVIAQFSYKFGF